MSASHLLDANALIALVLADHEHHERAGAWMATVDRVALCPIVEGALIRFLIRVGESHATATAVLRELYASPRCAFWPDSISHTSADLGHVLGHRQVTDAYLTSLAAAHDARLATFDRALAGTFPNRVDLIP
ncbi:TA system VapC family ribonuclease toxin [Conexibacter sp. DBS9H8]|uniref:TA system VapC family ribonuclease toxin n=1 Tax=Conexibacter sp. DBS9H8 TaxID=2937801 RepID=UPI00200F16A0|nr:TA system VapC family ribonuclease toxin [Conexibacter sp. DBS9H8]